MTSKLYSMVQRCKGAGVQGCALVLLLSAVLGAQTPPHLPPLDRSLPPAADRIYQALAPRVDAEVAMATVRLMSPRYETFADSSTGWEQRTGTLRLDGSAGEVVIQGTVTVHAGIERVFHRTPRPGLSKRGGRVASVRWLR